MLVRVNGDSLELPGPMTLSVLLTTLNIDPRRVAIEHNGTIIRRDRYDSSLVQAGDEIEIVYFVGGGSFLAK
jgi:thiamine biosynthesis protein ThiS